MTISDMRKIVIIFALCLFCASAALAQKAKYVFYFIGDGMGLNPLHTTELYLASLEGNVGIKHLPFMDFPYSTFATSYSANSDVTDSAAAGTALATGHKTKNAMLGMNSDSVAVNSIAVWAKNSGKKVGVCTNVCIDDATPAAFYAHQVNRKYYHSIGEQLAASGFHYFAGSDFRKPDENGVELHALCAQNGYTWAYGYQDAVEKMKTAEKLMMVQRKDRPAHIPYSIDRTADDLTLGQIVETGIKMLTKNNKNGFFLMVEGGAIDHALHGKDARTAIEDILDFDAAIQVAIDFYKQHPNETLIVVTADHDTGGMVPGNGRYMLNLEWLQYQSCSTDAVTARLNALKKNKMKKSWDDVKQVLSECYGLFTKVKVNWREEYELREAYEAAFEGNASEENLYSKNSALAAKARDILNRAVGISWASRSHSGSYVPVFAIGVGANQFHGRLNNTDLPLITAKIAGYRR